MGSARTLVHSRQYTCLSTKTRVSSQINAREKTLPENRTSLEEMLWSLKEWEKVQSRRDLGRLNLFWLGDNLRESLLPKDREPEIFSYWEFLAGSLDNQIDKILTNDVLTLAFRDAVALLASARICFLLPINYLLTMKTIVLQTYVKPWKLGIYLVKI